jgi:hypothetical protein
MAATIQNLPDQWTSIPGYKLDENGRPSIELYVSLKKLRQTLIMAGIFRVLGWTMPFMLPVFTAYTLLGTLLPPTSGIYPLSLVWSAIKSSWPDIESILLAFSLGTGMSLVLHMWGDHYMKRDNQWLSRGKPIFIVNEQGLTSLSIDRPDKFIAWDDVAEFRQKKGWKFEVVAGLKYQREGLWPIVKAAFNRTLYGGELTISCRYTDLTFDQWRTQIEPLLLDPKYLKLFFDGTPCTPRIDTV